MRFLLSKNSRIKLFEFLIKKYNANSLKDLSSKIKIPFKTLKKYRYAELYLPSSLIPEEFDKIEIVEKNQDNWGAVKGGRIGGRKNIENLKKLFGDEKYKKIKSDAGRKVMTKLWKDYGKKLTMMTIKGKLKKREKQSSELEQKNASFFVDNPVFLNLNNVKFSRIDLIKNIRLPKLMSIELAEEIGIHLGDGCMSYNRNYFSVKTNKKEENYVTDFLFPLYKKLYNIDLKLMQLKSVSGFEIYSKAVCEFKNKSLELPYGEKIGKIEVPKKILETKNKNIYRAFIRGLFDTNGCISMVKKGYPVISISIKSEKLINKVSEMLKMMGFVPYSGKMVLALNGPTMLKKWIKEINSSNPEKVKKLQWASSLTDKIFPCG